MLDSATAVLEDSADGLVLKADSLRSEVHELERGRQQAQLSVRLLRRPADLKKRFVETFPEIGGSDWGVTEIFSDDGGTPIGIQYVVVPFGSPRPSSSTIRTRTTTTRRSAGSCRWTRCSW